MELTTSHALSSDDLYDARADSLELCVPAAGYVAMATAGEACDAGAPMLVAGSDGALPEIIQTRRGEILVYRGHRYSKISLGGHRKYWRCTKRPCRAKIHTDLHTGAVLHISEVHTHGAPVEKTLKDRIEGLFYYQRAALPAAADSTGSPSTSGGAALVACSPFSSPTELVDHVVVFPLEGSSGHVRVPVEYEHMEVWFWPASFDDLPHLESHLVIYHLREIATACQNEAFSALASLLFDIPQEQVNKYHYVHSVEGGLAPELRRMLFDAHCREVADKLRCDADVPRGFVCRGDDNGVRGFGLFVDAANDGARALRSRLESSGRLHEWVPGVKYESGEEWAGEGEEEESREREWRRLRAWLAREAVGRPAARVRPRDELLRAPPACVTARLLTALESSSPSSSLPPATDAGGPWPAITFVLPLDGAVVAARRGEYARRVLRADAPAMLAAAAADGRGRAYFVVERSDFDERAGVPDLPGCWVRVYSAFDPGLYSVTCLVVEVTRM